MKKAIVYGGGISGKGAMLILKDLNIETILVDDKTALSSSDAIKLLETEKIDFFIKSPGIPYNDLLKKAIEKKIEIIDEIELTYRYMNLKNINTKIITVTGTNGKSTTTAKLAELLSFSSYKAMSCGNIGKSFAQTIFENRDLDFVVLEASSFQLENIKDFKPYISMIINLTPDHIERYKSFDEYYDTKFNMLKNCDNTNYFIENIDDENILNRENKIKTNVVTLSIDEKADIYTKDEIIYFKDEKIIDICDLALKGRHNLQNCLFMIATAKILNIENSKIVSFLKEAKPLEHRTENFFNYGNVKFINDSKATNVDSSLVAIDSYKNSILICGGYDKGVDLVPLVKSIVENIKEVYLIGVIANKLNKLLLEYNFPKEKIHLSENLENTLKILRNKLTKEDSEVILLSPATSSYDQFNSFEHRGKVFKELTRNIFGR